MTLLTRSRMSLVLLLSVIVGGLAACNPPASTPDASTNDAYVPRDTNAPFVPSWHAGPDYPTPIAFGAAMVLPGMDGLPYLYVIGGAEGSFADITQFHSEIRRAPIQADGSLGAWVDSGNIGTGVGNVQLAGHGAIRVVAEDGAIGFAVAGGGNSMTALPKVLAGYIQVDESIGMWGGFTPVISAAQGGQSFGSFNSFESHQLALVGGMGASGPTNHVIIAATMAGTMDPVWRDGPPLPTARYGHGSVQLGAAGTAQDIVLVGGMGPGNVLANDILVSVRNPTTLEIADWAPGGSLPSPVVFPQTVVFDNGHMYVIGGVSGDPLVDNLETSVRMSTTSQGAPHATIGTPMHVAGADLPEGRAGGLVAILGHTVYIVGGIMGADHTASTSVVYAQLER